MAYFWGWAICLLASGAVIVCGFSLTRWLRPLALRDLIRALASATLLVPVTAGSHDEFFAPAYIVLVFEAFLQPDGDPIPALSALTLGWVAAVLLVLLLAGRRAFAGRGAKADQSSSNMPS